MQSNCMRKKAKEAKPISNIKNVVLLGVCGTQSSIDVVKFYVKKLARENDDVILAHVQ